MNDDAQNIRDLIASKKEPCPLIPMHYAETQGLLTEDRKIEHVVREGAVFLRLGQDLVPHAISFRQLMNPASDTMLCFWLFQLAVEDGQLGSFYIDLARNESGDTRYQRVVKALGRVYSGEVTPQDVKLIQTHVKPSHFVHREQLEDVQKAIQSVQKKNQEKLEEETNKKKARVSKKGGTDPIVPAASPHVGIIPVPEIWIMNLASNHDTLRIIPRGEEETVANDDDLISVKPEDAVPFLSDVPLVINKVTTTIAVCKNVDGEPVGYLFRYLVHDARWNPGALVQMLIEENEQRKKNQHLPFYRDPRPHYLSWSGTAHPVHSLTLERWLKCANELTSKMPTFAETCQQLGSADRPEVMNSPINPLRVCNLSYALQCAREAGAHFSFSDQDFLKETTAYWPPEMDQVCRLLPKENFWDHTSHVGLVNRYLPFIPPQNIIPELKAYVETTTLPVQEEIASRIPKTNGVRTNNMLVLMANEADSLYDAATKNPKTIESTCKKQMQKLRMVCIPEPSALLHLNLSNVAKAMNLWFYDFCKTNSTISRKTERYDPKMSLKACMWARQLLQYEKFGKVVQTLIPLKLRGCLSVYQRRLGQILYNLLVYGDFGKGKSFLTISFLNKFMIPNTFTQLDRATAASDQTDQSVHDEIRGYHEAPEHFISEKASNTKRDEVNMKKASITDGTTTVNRAERKTIPGHGTMMVTSTTKRESNFTEVWCTNTQPDERALGNRLHNHLMLDSNIPTNELNYEVDTQDKREIIDTFRVNQFLSFWLEKAMATFAIPCRKPSMTLYHDISARMLESLKTWGVVSKRQSERALEIMEPMARQLTVEKAIMQTWHIEGAPHYGKQFEPEQMHDAAQFLWADSELALFVWTLHSADWVKSEFGDVLQALFRIAVHKEYNAKKTMYALFQEDTRGEINFRRDKNWSHDSTIDQKSHRFYTDLNYLEIPGQHKDIAAEVATMLNLSESDVLNLFQKMAERSFEPNDCGRTGYHRKMFADDLKQNHRGSWVTKQMLNKMSYRQVVTNIIINIVDTVYLDICKRCIGLPSYAYRNLNMTKGHEMFLHISNEELVFLYLCPEHIINYAGKDTLRDAVQQLDQTVVLSEEKRRRVLDAFTDIGPGEDYSLTVREMKILFWALERGWIMEPKNSNNTDTFYLQVPLIREGVDFPHFASDKDIAELNNRQIRVMDISSKSRVCFSPMAIPLFDKQIILDAFIYATATKSMYEGKRLLGWVDERDISKLKTIDFDRNYIDKLVDAFDAESPNEAVSRAEGIPFKRRQCVEDSAASMLFGLDEASTPRVSSKNIEVVRNLDEKAARDHYILCGLDPKNAIVYDWQMYKGNTGTLDYPSQIIEERIRQNKEHWEPNSATEKCRIISRSSGAAATESPSKKSKHGK